MQGGNATTWQLAAPAGAPAVSLSTGAGIAKGLPTFLGYGIVTPFRRTANDISAAGGAALVRSCVSQILGTRCDSPISSGELPWRTDFGALLSQLRHLPNDFMLLELARAYVADAVQRWEPRVVVTAVSVIQKPSQPRILWIRVAFDIIAANVPANQVVLPDQQGLSVEVPLQQAA